MTQAGESPHSSIFQATRMEDLAELADFVDDACQRAGVDADVTFAVRLAVEEVFTNILRHGYADHSGPVNVTIHADAHRMQVTLTDQAPVFDPVDAPVPDIAAPLEQREPGGLGWHLIRQLMDDIQHQAGRNGGNVLTLVKRLAPKDPST